MYSKESYRSLLEQALQQGYRFVRFVDDQDASRRIFLRHDVDYSLDLALELAGVNASLNVSGTFFLLLRSQAYNLLSHWGLSRVRDIQALGQRIAFHCALPPCIPDSDDELCALVRSDFDLLKRHIDDLEQAFSWHNPTPAVLHRSLSFDVPGLVNVYGERFVKKIRYVSDSNMRHSPAQFHEMLHARHYSELHLLLHPLNWMVGGQSMSEVIAKAWQHIIREKEHEFQHNHQYQKLLPQGMPATVLESFSEEWLKAAKQQGK